VPPRRRRPHPQGYAGRRWIACRLRVPGRRRGPLLQPGRFTELFFLDEATAFAAGHRPCALCRRDDYNRFVSVWRELYPGTPGADAIDSRLHAERVEAATGAARIHQARLERLPDGAFVLRDGKPWLVRTGELLRWTAAGYAERSRRSASGEVGLVTPPSIVAILGAGWKSELPFVHPSAD